jgi:hypothetical protein
VVDRKNVDSLAVVCDAVAGAALKQPLVVLVNGSGCAYLVAVPSGDALVSANVGVAGNLALVLPAVLGDEAVCAIRAGYGGEGSVLVIVAGVVGDCDGQNMNTNSSYLKGGCTGDGRGERSKADDGGRDGAGEHHVRCWVVWSFERLSMG